MTPDSKAPRLDGTSVGSNGLLSGSEADKLALERAQKAKDALNGSAVGSNGLISNDLDKTIENATSK